MNLSSKKMLALSGAVLGVIAAVLALGGNPKNMAICVACFIRDTAGAMKFHNAAVVQYVRPEVVGIVLGAFLISLVKKEYKAVVGSAPVIRFLLGVIMMTGALAFLGCPLRMLIRMAAGDLNAYVALAGFCGGIFTGTLALKKGYSLGKVHEARKQDGFVFPSILAVIFILSVATSLFVVSEKGPGSMHAPAALALAAGLLFGALAQRTRTCFAGSVRNVILIKNFDMISQLGGFFVVMLIFNIAVGGFKLSFDGQPVAHAQHLWNFLGLYVVGFAAILAGGCPLRQLVLAGQGSLDAVMTFLGLFVGAAICHNFGLAATAAAAATGETPAVLGGPSTAGKIAVLVCAAILFLIGFGMREKQQENEKN